MFLNVNQKQFNTSVDSIKLRFPYLLPEGRNFLNEKKLSRIVTIKDSSSPRFRWIDEKYRKRQKAKGKYVPNFGMDQDYMDSKKTFFSIECSIPKLMGGDNLLTQISNKETNLVANKLHLFCKEIGINISTYNILNCRPTMISFGKNISLTELCSSDLALNVLSPFNYKAHAKCRRVGFDDLNSQGKEIIFHVGKFETIKFYDKKREVINNAKTTKEQKLADILKKGNLAIEILRNEITYKNNRKIEQKFKPYLKNKPLVFKNILNEKIFEDILGKEVNKVFNSPIRKVMLLASEQKPIIDAYFDKHFCHINLKDSLWGIVNSLQEFGYAETRKRYLRKFKSKQTWYNYLKRIEKISELIDFTSLPNLDNHRIHSYILNQFGIKTMIQDSLFLENDSLKK